MLREKCGVGCCVHRWHRFCSQLISSQPIRFKQSQIQWLDWLMGFGSDSDWLNRQIPISDWLIFHIKSYSSLRHLFLSRWVVGLTGVSWGGSYGSRGGPIIPHFSPPPSGFSLPGAGWGRIRTFNAVSIPWGLGWTAQDFPWSVDDYRGHLIRSGLTSFRLLLLHIFVCRFLLHGLKLQKCANSMKLSS